MLRTLATLAIAALAMTSVADDKNKASTSDVPPFEKYREYLLSERIFATRPVRRVYPLREIGPSATEVEEMQAVAQAAIPKAIIHIGPVVTGCHCENGPDCTAEVWVDGYQPGRIAGILLSQIEGQWRIGPIQKWWIDRGKLSTRGYFELIKFESTFPACEFELRRMYEERYVKPVKQKPKAK